MAALRKKVSGLARGREEAPGARAPEATLSQVAGELGQLYGQVCSADVAPTSSQAAALAVVEKNYAAVMARWNAIKSSDLPALNRQLSGAGLSEIKLEAEPEPASESENEE